MRRWASQVSVCLLASALVLASAGRASAQGVTGSAVTGTITQEGGAGIEGANIALRNTATGASFSAISRADGRYLIDNALAGGPYTLTVRAIGFEPVSRTGLQLSLGQRLNSDFRLRPSAVELQAVVVQGEPSPLSDETRTGAQTILSDNGIQHLPLLGRNFTDLIGSAPQVGGGSGLSIAGQNNRYNNIQIDGGPNNDLFGLTGGNGTPGGQSRAKPISLEAVQEFQVLIAPFDVRQGNFTGGLVNAITKSGTNTLHGSLFGYYRGKDIVGYRDDPRFASFNIYQYGATLGGPIIRDRLHFFVAGDFQSSAQPFTSSFNLSGNNATDVATTGFTTADATRFRDILINQYKYPDVGDFSAPSLKNPDRNVFAKLSGQLSANSRLEVSYNWVKASDGNLGRGATSPSLPVMSNAGVITSAGRLRDGYQLSNSGYDQTNKTNTLRGKWTTNFGRSFSNEFLAGAQWIRDARDVVAQVPLVLVRAGTVGSSASFLAAGTERFSTGNSLDQNVYSLSDNLSFNLGDAHRVTVGTANEFFSFNNVFFQAKNGIWAFGSLDSLAAGLPDAYQRRLPGDATLRPLGPVADFSVKQYGVFGQDQWSPNRFVTLTGGLRVDIPTFDRPVQNPALVNNTALPINTADVPTGNALWSPRLGFNIDVSGRSTSVVRGGVGYFSGRPPYVWLSNAFVGTGLEQVEVTCRRTTNPATSNLPTFTLDPAAQPTACAGAGAAALPPSEIDYFDPNFKFPQTFRVALGVDQQLPLGIVGTVDLLYSKMVNALYVTDQNIVETGINSEGRYLYGTATPAGVLVGARKTTAITNAVYHSNTPAGRTYQAAFQLTRRFRGFELNAGYAYSNTKDAISLTSSQAFSNYQFAALDGSSFNRNLRTSFFDTPHKITISGTVDLPFRTSLSLFYRGFSGTPYTWNLGGDANADGVSGNDLPYIPRNASEISLVTPSQYAALDQFITSQPCLQLSRGAVLPRNSCRNPWRNFVDMRLTGLVPSIRGQNLELTLDLFNALNFIDRDWGLTKQVSFNETTSSSFLSVSGYDTQNDRPRYSFRAPTTVETIVYGANDSRWRMQFGAKYRF
jgi:outer membrane receptor protein involved in Fe transport